MARRRSLSEVIGALVVLSVVIIATISMLRLSQEVVSVTQRVSSEDFVRSSQEATPPTMSVIVRNSTLYMLVSYPVPLNISYAILNVSGKLIVERLDKLVSGEAVIPLLTNYSCQNVSIELVSSSGATFRYVPSEDPLLQGRVRPGVYYFSCSLLSSSTQEASEPSQQPYAYSYSVPGAVPVSADRVYLVGMSYGNGTLTRLGVLKIHVNAAGWFSTGINVTAYVNGSKLSGYLRGVASKAYLGSVYVGGVRVAVVAFVVGGPQPYFGISLVGPSLLVNFTGSTNISGVTWSGYTGPPGVMVPLVMGLSGNVSGTAYGIQGNDVLVGSAWYYSFNYNGTATGQGLTSGPIALATYYDLVPCSYANMSLDATLLVGLWSFSGNAQETMSLPGPVEIGVASVEANSTPLAEAAALTYSAAAYFRATIATAYGNATEETNQLLLLAPSAKVTLEAPEPVELSQGVGLAINLTNYLVSGLTASRANFWARALPEPQPVPLAYAIEVNASGSTYLLVPPSVNSTGAYINGGYQQGPVLVAVGGPQVSGLKDPVYIAPLDINGTTIYIGAWSQVNQSLPAGAYALWSGDGLYWLVVSGPS